MNKENLCRVGHRVRNLRSGLGLSRVYEGICQVLANRFIGQQFSELWHCAHEENSTVNVE